MVYLITDGIHKALDVQCMKYQTTITTVNNTNNEAQQGERTLLIPQYPPLPHLSHALPSATSSKMEIDFGQARASDFVGIQKIFKHYICNSVMVLARDMNSILERIQQNLYTPDDEEENDDDDDDTAVFPAYLPVPVLVARKIDRDNKNVKSQIVGYTFLGPCRRNTTGDAELFLFVHPEHTGQGIGGSLLSMLLMLVQSERGIKSYDWMAPGDSGFVYYVRREARVRKVAAVVSIDPEAADCGEWLPRWLETKGFQETRRLDKVALRFGRW